MDSEALLHTFCALLFLLATVGTMKNEHSNLTCCNGEFIEDECWAEIDFTQNYRKRRSNTGLSEPSETNNKSPIDIRTSQAKKKNFCRRMEYSGFVKHERTLLNTGYGWRVEENEKGPILTGGPFGSARFRLQQFHCHWGDKEGVGSEHTVDGKSYSGEIHLVHWNMKYESYQQAKGQQDGLVVVAIFLKVGYVHQELLKVINVLPYIKYKENKITLVQDVDPLKFFPERKGYWTYSGSLTTSTDGETVYWMVMQDPMEVSSEQLELMRELQTQERCVSCPLLQNYSRTHPLGSRELVEVQPPCSSSAPARTLHHNTQCSGATADRSIAALNQL